MKSWYNAFIKSWLLVISQLLIVIAPITFIIIGLRQLGLNIPYISIIGLSLLCTGFKAIKGYLFN